MKVLVTGGSGYVASRLKHVLKHYGHDVRLLMRRDSALPAESDEFETVHANIFDTNACLHAADGCDAVVHLVGIIREFPSKGITFDELHRVATGNIVDAARRVGVDRFVYMSGLGAREDARSEYHRTKFLAEQVVMNSPMRWTVFRPSWIFSPGDALSLEIKNLVEMPVSPLIGGGTNLMQPVALDDVCECFSKALSLPETQEQTYELGGPDRIAFRDIVQKSAIHLGITIHTVSIPIWAMRPVVRFLQRFPSFPLTVDQLRMLAEDNVCEIDPYVKAFKLEPRSFVAALPGLFHRDVAAPDELTPV